LTQIDLPIKQAQSQFAMDFSTVKKGEIFIGCGDRVFILLNKKSPIGWFIYSYSKEKSIHQTGLYVKEGLRNKGFGKELTRRFVKFFDKKYGRGKYTFDSTIVTRKGAKLMRYRLSLVGNPEEHIFDEPEPHLLYPTY
jgi:predicted GNAT family acetyltransferase